MKDHADMALEMFLSLSKYALCAFVTGLVLLTYIPCVLFRFLHDEAFRMLVACEEYVPAVPTAFGGEREN